MNILNSFPSIGQKIRPSGICSVMMYVRTGERNNKFHPVRYDDGFLNPVHTRVVKEIQYDLQKDVYLRFDGEDEHLWFKAEDFFFTLSTMEILINEIRQEVDNA